MNDNDFRAIQYEAALQYLTRKREDVHVDWKSVKFYATFFTIK